MTTPEGTRKDLQWPHSTLIVGCGLIGVSIAKAFAQVLEPGHTFDGVDVRSHHRQLADETGLFSNLYSELPPSGRYDLVILATPVDVACEQLEQSSRMADCVMDVCSAKTDICNEASRLGLAFRFSPTHPMAGLAAEGPLSASGGLFRNQPWLGLEDWPTDSRILAVIEAVGARWQTVKSAADHDAMMAAVSHGIHLTSLAAMLSFARSQKDYLPVAARLCGPGFRDITRLAASPSGFWTSTLLANRSNTVKALERTIAELGRFLDLLNHGDEEGLHHLLEEAREARKQWENAQTHDA